LNEEKRLGNGERRHADLQQTGKILATLNYYLIRAAIDERRSTTTRWINWLSISV